MKKVPFFLLSLFFIISCEETPLLYSSVQNFNETNLPICENSPCPSITFDFPVYSGDELVASRINSEIKSFLIACLHLGEGIPKEQSLEAAAFEFVRANNDLKTDFDMDLNYEATASVSEVYRNENVLSIEKRSYLFTGGAHGYGSTHFTHFDLKSGEELKTSELFDDFKGFMSKAEEVFRNAQGLSEVESINAKGFWFEDDRFYLPDTIGLSEQGILLVYNQYDIASYADGPIEVIVGWEAVAPFLSKTYFK